jgi:broad specificity phosphatase PhoE
VKIAIRALLLIAIFASATSASAQEAIYLVRHTERADQSADSPLSPAGEARAERLAAALRDAGITHVFTTDLKRTIQTAAPLATAHHLMPQALPAGDVDGLVAKIRSLGPGDRPLIVGHSNTIPVILFALGGGTVTIAEAEFDNLFIVVPRRDAAPVSLRIRY